MKYQLLIAGVLLFAMACGGNQEQSQEQESTPQSMVQEEAVPPEEAVVSNEAGKKVYDQYCLVCHQADGQGVPNAFPPLTKTEYVLGDTEQLIAIVLNGLSGEIEVNGQTYNGVMVAHNFLTDTEIADVITYVRGSFGNDASGVTPEEVAAVRSSQ